MRLILLLYLLRDTGVQDTTASAAGLIVVLFYIVLPH